MKIFFAILTVLSVLLSFDCSGGSHLTVSEGWARATRTDTTTAYLLIENNGKDPDTLMGVSINDGTVAGEITTMELIDGVEQAHPVTRLPIAAGKTLRLRPGKTYLTLRNLKQALIPGATLHAKLTFEKAGEIEQGLQIEPADATRFDD